MHFLTLFLSLNLLSAGPDTAEYRQYETENVAVYRQKFGFVQPVVDLPKDHSAPVVVQPVSGDPSDTLRVTWQVPDALLRMFEMHHPSGAISIDGYRVQIYAGPNYDAAKRLKAEFIQSFPSNTVYDTWESPHFRVRTGDFLSRNEALTFANHIKDKFPGAFVVPDKIKVKKKAKVFIAPEEISPEDTPRDVPHE